jgi:hypothetical protein
MDGEMRGWLKKQSQNAFVGWQQRFFALNPGDKTLKWFTNDRMLDLKGEWDLSVPFTIETFKDSRTENGFVLSGRGRRNTNGSEVVEQQVRLLAESLTGRNEWIAAINNVSGSLQGYEGFYPSQMKSSSMHSNPMGQRNTPTLERKISTSLISSFQAHRLSVDSDDENIVYDFTPKTGKNTKPEDVLKVGELYYIIMADGSKVPFDR